MPTESEMTTVDHYAIRLTCKYKIFMSNPNTIIISKSESEAIYSSARKAVEICARNYADKTGFKHFFTQEDIEDIANDTAYRAYRSFATFDGGKSKLSTWVNRIAVNTFRDALDNKMKRRNISCELIEENSESGEEYNLDEVCRKSQESHCEGWTRMSEDEADKELLRKDFEAYISDSLPGLSERDRKFLEWMKLGYTAREMAAMDGCSTNAASKRMWAIRQRASEIFGGVRLADMKAA